MNRRGFLAGMLAACAAPAVVKAASLMPVRAFVKQASGLLIMDGPNVITLTQAFHVDTYFTEQDLTLNICDFQDRILAPGWKAIAQKIDRDVWMNARVAA